MSPTTLPEQPTEAIVGRAGREGARLFRGWFDRLASGGEDGRQAAYVFVMGSLTELLEVFDLNAVFPEINSLQTAVRKVADGYIAEAEEHGYSPDICAYVKADFAMQMRGGEHPMGRIPPPSIAVLTNACNTYIKWAEIWERLYDIPTVTIDIPCPRTGRHESTPSAEDYRNDLAYVLGQVRELIATCEQLTGKRFDIDRLREALGHANDQMRAWARVHELNRNVPALYNAITDGTVYLGVANAFKGRPEGARFFEDLVEELEYKAANGIAALPDEQYRLIFMGVPCYPIFRRFDDLFASHGGTFVVSAYTSFASGGIDMGFQYDLDRPLESLAEGLMVTCQHGMEGIFHNDKWIRERLEDYSIDGVVYHPIKSCRTISTGLADSRRNLTDRTGVLSLVLESDMMDSRVVSEAQMRNRVDAFFEGLTTRRLGGRVA
ncbi:MAG: 2-hydroxyacyl-CoA dehydratase family protein [Alphaproteobacteria bacterium]|jgi:benzoyl-CoA reductase subunit B|nr:2-hydroxyacyl-CoA dehydratase family protein [Alphaproteobacteria bacterium]MDP6567949.1 2-hydroxyacyl-CoA dehydratase family protein [Alphaproteobacteria bacterium]MDP6812359.1 2-hydroxyacyl-CoA dehydratase family protein [Alphaproteobacteria bacterium]